MFKNITPKNAIFFVQQNHEGAWALHGNGRLINFIVLTDQSVFPHKQNFAVCNNYLAQHNLYRNRNYLVKSFPVYEDVFISLGPCSLTVLLLGQLAIALN